MAERGAIKVIRKTPTVDTSAYADADRLGSIMTFTGALGGILGLRSGGIIRSVSVVLESGTAAPMTLHLFRSLPTIASADNAALDITDAQLTANWVGKADIVAANFEVMAAGAVGTLQGLNICVDSSDGHLYGVLQAQGAITFTAAE